MGFQEEAFVDAAMEEEELKAILGAEIIATDKMRQRKDPGKFRFNWKWDPSEAKLSLLKSVYTTASLRRGEKEGWRRVHGEEDIAVGGDRSGDD